MIVRKYLEVFGPAAEEDIVWWSGLGKTQVRKALKALEGEAETDVRIKDLDAEHIMLSSDTARLDRRLIELIQPASVPARSPVAGPPQPPA